MKLLWCAILCLSCIAPALAQDADQPPIENFISPPQLFPSEGGLRAPYAPLAAFDRVAGKVIGHVKADLLPCPPREGETVCGIPISWYLELLDGRRADLTTDEVSYEQGALVSYQAATVIPPWAWSEVESPAGRFWIRTPVKDVSAFETHATQVHDFDVWCSRPGQCAPVSAAMKQEIGRMMAGQFQLRSCGEQTYEIHGLVKQGSRHYYKVTRTEVEAGTPQPGLPLTGYIPTRRNNGSHAGIFFSRGC
jgi:hypothetical protein